MYPVMLDLENKQVLVVGGGKIATNKIHKLVEQKADVIVVSPELTDELHSLLANGKIEWVPRTFVKDDVKGAFLVFAATNSRTINEEVKRSCSKGQLFNAIDAPDESNFYNMAVITRGNLHIAVSTEGTSPQLARQIKQDLQQFFNDGYEEYLNFIGEARTKIKEIIQDEKLKKYLLLELVNDLYRKNEVERQYFLKQLKG